MVRGASCLVVASNLPSPSVVFRSGAALSLLAPFCGVHCLCMGMIRKNIVQVFASILLTSIATATRTYMVMIRICAGIARNFPTLHVVTKSSLLT